MSRENVEVVQRLYALLRRPGDPSAAIRRLLDGDIAAELLDPEIEWHGTVGGLSEGAIARGHVEAVQFMLDDSQEWEKLVIEPTEFIDLGDIVVVLQRERRRGRQSGVEIETDTASVLRLRDGRIFRLQGYMDQAAALEAAGAPGAHQKQEEAHPADRARSTLDR
jgi:ketosteroid isomerase-like protein